MQIAIPSPAIVATLMRREIDRFIQAARVRSEFDIDTRRRSMRRYHRSWPLMVCDTRDHSEISAALHNASANGIGFFCEHEFEEGQVVLIKLFWHEDAALRVPAIVKHVSPHREALLTGCQFAIENESACAAGFKARNWYDA